MDTSSHQELPHHAAPSAQGEHASHTGHATSQAANHAGSSPHMDHAGHGAHAGHSPAMFRRPFWISLALTILVVAYSGMIQMLLGYTAPAFPGSAYVGLALGSVIFWYGGWPFLSGAAGEIRRRTPESFAELRVEAPSGAFDGGVASGSGEVEWPANGPKRRWRRLAGADPVRRPG